MHLSVFCTATSQTKQAPQKKNLKMKVSVAAFLLIVGATSAFLASPAATTLGIYHTKLRAERSVPRLNAIKGAAEDAEEDLKLTLQIVMDHAKRVGKARKDEPKDDTRKETAEEAAPVSKSKKVAKESPRKVERATDSEKAGKDPPAAEPATPFEIIREFRFVASGETGATVSGTSGRPTISCDGRITDVTLELTHWNGNETPDKLYADTSTEMALNLAHHSDYVNATKDAFVLNNHFDSDGVLSVWACLEPELAQKYAELMIQGAEAGDFSEWSSDEGVKLDCALTELRKKFDGSGEGTAFVVVLMDHLPGLLEDLQSTGGEAHRHLWVPGFAKALKSWENLQNDEAKLEVFNDDIVIVERPWSVPLVSPYALHRKLKEDGLDLSTKRILNVLTDAKGARFKYEKIGHGWVNKLVQRQPVPGVDSEKLVEDLNKDYKDGNWRKGGDGLVSICQSINITSTPTQEIAEYLAKHDDGL